MKIRRPGDYSSGRTVRPDELPWDQTTWKEPPAREWTPNRIPCAYLTCGCNVVPWPLIRAFGVSEAWCDRHGWQKLRRNQHPEYERIPTEYGYQTRLM